MKALLSIDYTNDFIDDNGALTCGEPGQAIESAITRLTREFIENGDYVVFAIDKHISGDKNHPETRLFPPHNIEGGKGRLLYGGLMAAYEEFKNAANVYWMDKTRYSAFAGTDLYLRLKERGINEIHLSGVCTDICVLHTMVDGYNLGYSMVAHEKAMASFNAVGHEWALGHFKNALGAEVV
ncbi:MAG: cysteine hydrolase [Clostridiales bacterium]|nr:cysteine hydrolase [Clostridiales bacterium]